MNGKDRELLYAVIFLITANVISYVTLNLFSYFADVTALSALEIFGINGIYLLVLILVNIGIFFLIYYLSIYVKKNGKKKGQKKKGK